MNPYDAFTAAWYAYELGRVDARQGLASRVSHLADYPELMRAYRRGYEAHFERVDGWLEGIEGLLSFGRQGLFAHDNTHHTLAMARAADVPTKASTSRPSPAPRSGRPSRGASSTAARASARTVAS